MTDGALPLLGAHEADMAATLLDLAEDFGSDRVLRARIRSEWVADHPEHMVEMPRHGDGRREPIMGKKGRARILSALVALERHGMIRRDGADVVALLDRAALERLAVH